MESTKTITDKAYIKLYKNSRGYNWEIKAYQDVTDEDLSKIKEKLLKINNDLANEFCDLE